MLSIMIRFRPEKDLILPFAKFEILQGLFYQLLSIDLEYASKIHDKNHESRQRYKLFCFTDIKGKPIVTENSLIYSGDLQWEIRSVDDAIIKTIEKRLTQFPVWDLQGVKCNIVSIHTSNLKFFTTEVLLSMLTPITVYETKDRFRSFFNPSQERFYQSIEKNLIRKYLAFKGEAELSLDVSFSRCRNATCKKCITRYHTGIIESYYGLYILKAPEELVDFAYYAGLGVKNSQGFGTVNFHISAGK